MVVVLNCLSAAIISTLLLGGCITDTPNLVDEYQVGDSQMSCAAIKAEISDLKRRGEEIAGAKSSTTKKKVALGVGGLFVWPAWFFMNLSSGKKQELKSIENRINALKKIGLTKCDSHINPEQQAPAPVYHQHYAPPPAYPASQPPLYYPQPQPQPSR